MLHAGGRQRMWMGVCVLMNLGASSGHIIIIPVNTTVGAEVSIHTFGAIGVGMVALLGFLICSEHLFSISALFFVYIAVIHDGGLAKLSISFLKCAELLFQNHYCFCFIIGYAQIFAGYVVAY